MAYRGFVGAESNRLSWQDRTDTSLTRDGSPTRQQPIALSPGFTYSTARILARGPQVPAWQPTVNYHLGVKFGTQVDQYRRAK